MTTEEKENKQILNAYRGVLRSMKIERSKEDTKQIRKAFDVAVNASVYFPWQQLWQKYDIAMCKGLYAVTVLPFRFAVR